MYTSSTSSSSVDKYGTGRTATKYLYRGTATTTSSSSSSYGALTADFGSDRRSRAYNSAPRHVPAPSSLTAGRPGNVVIGTRSTDINGNAVRSLSLGKNLSPSSAYATAGSRAAGAAADNAGSAAALLLLGNDKRYEATKKRLDAFYGSRSSPSPSLSMSLNKSYNYRTPGDLSYFEKYNKQQSQDTTTATATAAAAAAAGNDEPVQQLSSRYVNMNRSKYGSAVDGSGTPYDNNRSSSSDAAKRSAAGVVGIRNIGNTCYMNSVLQCLSNTKGLTDSVLADADADGKLIRVYRDLLSRIWSPDGHHPVDTTAFKAAFQRLSPRFAGYEQQDSQEFLRLLLDRLHMDINRAKAKPRTGAVQPDPDTLKDSALAAHHWQRYLATDNSTVVDLFAGQLKSTLECSVCGHKSITFEVFWDLSLSLPSGGGAADQVSLADLLENFTQEEVLDYRERPRCAVCKADRKMYKAYSFQKLPRYLVLHLKRFQGTHSYKKITSLVAFPVASLDMAPYVSAGGGSARGGGGGTRYALYAVSNHSGTPIAGHYTAFCRHPVAGDWNFFNDSSVSRITSPSKIISNEAYILFYEAVN